MNRVDKVVILVVAFFLLMALLKAALEVAAQLSVLVTSLGAVYFSVRLWKAGKLDFLRPARPAAQPVERE